MFDPPSHPHFVSKTLTRSVEAGVSFSYTLAGTCGAALVTMCQAHREHTPKRGTFMRYAKQHYDSWITLVSEEGYGDDVEPILVYAVDRTKDFAMAAYWNESSSFEGSITTSVPMFGSASASAWGTWSCPGQISARYGPQQYAPPSAAQRIGSSSQTTTTEGIDDDFNQCVFIRYFIRRPRAGLFPMVMKGAAGPHDLGSGQAHDSTFPELTAQSGPNIEYDEPSDCEAQSLAPGDDCSEQDTIVDNMPNVRYSPNTHCGPQFLF